MTRPHRGAVLLEYRCRAKGCLLLQIWQTPDGPKFRAPANRVSGRYGLARNVERSALTGEWAEMPGWEGPGAPAETSDWVGWLADYPPEFAWLRLVCTHVDETAWVRDLHADLAGASPGRPVRILRPDTGGGTGRGIA
ncbi:hypothetical protein MKUB_43790 [Mycobacterium kubicae]|uniref:Uncharacterized protein n=1 Tax=Mycobacterium kubicae TaxID=120959 RepID=A0AAX1J6M6_9MYCO|nr:hypothetical protein [Mycobacterium kubicae]MCV7095390.1 hypothetical protein [Mycobacterium kubicae]ORW06252.1 hypothetical protein AWC13_00035 [Mycobacterium kubicae]QNI13531.1 hypothetical protein GAN18_22350 [Mycobacterium kubicae]QPI37048.1 hypothetical protein I2456_21930 [Mycobacterium kubicae]GFG66889.1 hypothetical protein MKUB_43790 [Mycobacterium kubicae]